VLLRADSLDMILLHSELVMTYLNTLLMHNLRLLSVRRHPAGVLRCQPCSGLIEIRQPNVSALYVEVDALWGRRARSRRATSLGR